MTSDDREVLAQLWLAELGAHVPEWSDGGTLAPRVRRFGLDLDPWERAGAHSEHLAAEPLRARTHRARSDSPDGRG